MLLLEIFCVGCFDEIFIVMFFIIKECYEII